jgi:hypothetical protein
MKLFIKLVLLSAVLLSLYGCASGTYETRLAPPDSFNPVFLRYKEQPGQKVMVAAIDPTGQWAFGYDYGRTNLQEAAETAALRCDKQREEHKVFTKAKLFAINDEIVYYNPQ